MSQVSIGVWRQKTQELIIPLVLSLYTVEIKSIRWTQECGKTAHYIRQVLSLATVIT